MRYNIKGTGIGVTDELRAYAERQLAHADKFVGSDPTALCDVEIEYLPEGRSAQYRAEFTLSASGTTYRASAWSAQLHEALDVAGQELMAELRKSAKKRLRVFRHTAVQVKEYLRGWRDKI